MATGRPPFFVPIRKMEMADDEGFVAVFNRPVSRLEFRREGVIRGRLRAALPSKSVDRLGENTDTMIAHFYAKVNIILRLKLCLSGHSCRGADCCAEGDLISVHFGVSNVPILRCWVVILT